MLGAWRAPSLPMKRCWVVAAVFFLMSGIGSVRADDTVPDAATLEARMATAIGPANKNYRDTVVEHRGDGDAVYTHAYRGDNELTTKADGQALTVYGTSAGQGWNEDENGITVANLPDPVVPPHGTIRKTVARVASPVDAYVLSVLDDAGIGYKDYVDPVNYLLLRKETIDADGTTTLINGPYRRCGTQMMPASWSVSSTNAPTPKQYTLRTCSIGDVSAADVAVPPVRQLVNVPRNLLTVDLNAVFGTGINDGITVPVTIGNKRLYFMLDSGAGGIVIDSDVAASLGLANVGSSVLNGTGRERAGEVVIPRMDVGAVEMDHIFASTVPFGSGRTPSDPAGLLGFDFMAELIVNVDYAHKRVVVSDPRLFTPPVGRNVDAIPVRLGEHVPLISMNIGGAPADRVLVDTGNYDGLSVLRSFALRHAAVFKERPAADVLQSINQAPDYGFSRGIGGESGIQHTAVPFIHLGHYNISPVDVNIVTSRHAFEQDFDGLLGRDILRGFNLDFDYADGLIYLWPASGGP